MNIKTGLLWVLLTYTILGSILYCIVFLSEQTNTMICGVISFIIFTAFIFAMGATSSKD